MLDFTPEGDVKVSLIDFGAVRVYIDEYHRHLQPSQTEVFIGNMLFSSSNQMNFGTCSRKDDLISWFYIMLFLLDSIVIVPDTEPENDFRELFFKCWHQTRFAYENNQIAPPYKSKEQYAEYMLKFRTKKNLLDAVDIENLYLQTPPT